MHEINHTTPDDINALKRIIASHEYIMGLKEEALSKERQERERKEFELDELIKKYEEIERKYKYLQKYFFGKRSEKLPAEEVRQGRLFDEAERYAEEEKHTAGTEEPAEAEKAAVTIVKQHTRKKAGRKAIPDDLPREEIIHDIPEEEKHCGCCGNERPVIGKEESEE